MKKAKLRRLTLHRETLRRLDSRELTRIAGGTSLTLTACPLCDTNDCGGGGGGGGSTLSCTEFVCIA